jgi:uncharacterized protein (TIGR02444 family)
MDERAESDSCWTFVVDLYARPGISQACLELQDRLDVDVSFLLTILFYAKHRGMNFSVDEIASLDRSISAWRDEVIRPLRRLRRRLKAADLLKSSTEELYRRIKADELLAERLEIGELEQLLEKMPAAQSTFDAKRDVVERVVKHFAEVSQHPEKLTDEAIGNAVALLCEAAR